MTYSGAVWGRSQVLREANAAFTGRCCTCHLRVASAFMESLFQILLPKNTIQEIKYFTALVSARPNDPSQPQRQQLYLRALNTLPKVSVHLGHFLVHEVTMPLVVASGQPQQCKPPVTTTLAKCEAMV